MSSAGGMWESGEGQREEGNEMSRKLEVELIGRHSLYSHSQAMIEYFHGFPNFVLRGKFSHLSFPADIRSPLF